MQASGAVKINHSYTVELSGDNDSTGSPLYNHFGGIQVKEFVIGEKTYSLNTLSDVVMQKLRDLMASVLEKRDSMVDFDTAAKLPNAPRLADMDDIYKTFMEEMESRMELNQVEQAEECVLEAFRAEVEAFRQTTEFMEYRQRSTIMIDLEGMIKIIRDPIDFSRYNPNTGEPFLRFELRLSWFQQAFNRVYDEIGIENMIDEVRELIDELNELLEALGERPLVYGDAERADISHSQLVDGIDLEHGAAMRQAIADAMQAKAKAEEDKDDSDEPSSEAVSANDGAEESEDFATTQALHFQKYVELRQQQSMVEMIEYLLRNLHANMAD
jgi:hypothetical protein